MTTHYYIPNPYKLHEIDFKEVWGDYYHNSAPIMYSPEEQQWLIYNEQWLQEEFYPVSKSDVSEMILLFTK